MIALKILDLRRFMSAFLTGDTFDGFQLLEGQITTFCTFQIDGRWQESFFSRDSKDPDSEEEAGEAPVRYTPWSSLKEYCYSLIRGKRTPLSFRFIFQTAPEQTDELFTGTEGLRETVRSLSLNLRYDGSSLFLTTGTSRTGFTRDRSADHLWDEWVLEFLRDAGVASELL